MRRFSLASGMTVARKAHWSAWPGHLRRLAFVRHAGHSTAPPPWMHAARNGGGPASPPMVITPGGEQSKSCRREFAELLMTASALGRFFAMETALWHGVIRRSVIVLLGRLDERRGLVFPSDACAPRRSHSRHSTCKSSATSSLWRCVSVLAKTDFN